jgi:ATP-dependent helicase HrpB
MVLASSEARAPASDATTAALVDRVRSTRLEALRWRDSDRSLQARISYARQALGEDWPSATDAVLLATLDEWLAPQLVGATGRGDLERVDLSRVLRDLVGRHRAAELDRLVPTSVSVASGRTVPIDYSAAQPTIAVRVQDLYGTTSHPAIAKGRVPLVVHLLSPAGRPVQVTSDLPGFWTGSWSEVRKDMAGRYPKHDWPLDPSIAAPSRPRRRR